MVAAPSGCAPSEARWVWLASPHVEQGLVVAAFAICASTNLMQRQTLQMQFLQARRLPMVAAKLYMQRFLPQSSWTYSDDRVQDLYLMCAKIGMPLRY